MLFRSYKYAEYLMYRKVSRNIFLNLIMFLGIGIFIFILLSIVRGFTNGYQIISQIFDYGPASFNRLAAFLSGQLTFYGENSGIYVSSFQGQIPIIKNYIDIYKLLGQPSLDSVWLENFRNVGIAGLNAQYTFPTVYGAIYSFFGWLSPLYFLFLGFFYKQVIHSINKIGTFGIVFYPFFIFSLFFWFGWNFLLSYNFIVLIILDELHYY